MINSFKQLAQKIIDAVFPRHCLSCEKIEGVVLCKTCRSVWSPSNPPMSSSQLSTFYYADKIARRLICDWKFSFDTECRDELFRQLKTRLGPVKKIVKSQNIETICCVPLHAIKKRMRGFDQAEQLAQLIAQKTHSMYIPLLIRAKTTTSQADKKTADRRQIIDQNPFVINPAFNVPKRVLLVDDVWTTGSTATAAINVLKSAGVEQVIVYTAARG